MSSELEALNNLCRDLYESVDQQTRLRAEQNLSELAESSECLQRCMLLLEQGIVPYGPMVATKTLMKLLNTKAGIMPADRLELCRYLLGHLGSRASSLPPFVVTELCQLFARITKLEWTYFDPQTQDYPFRNPIDSIVKTISMDNISESLLAIQLLSLLVVDVNSPVGMESVSIHRKSSSSFRDQYLFNIFQLTVDLLKKANEKSLGEQEQTLSVAVLDLCLNCLLFDFIGSLADETSEDNYNVQVPTIWRVAFTDGSIVQLMFSLYQKLPETATEKILQIVVQLASIRRTLFNGQERQAYLKELIIGVRMTIQNPAIQKLSDRGAFHEFCRLVARLKTNFQLCEMLKVEEYSGTVRLLAEFTIQSLRMMEFANSSYFLLTFWQRMVTSVPYVRTQDEHYLNIVCPEIFASYVDARLNYVERVIRDGRDDPLEDQGAIIQVMEQLSIICRCEYKKTYELLVARFDENASIVEQGPDGDMRVRLAEGRLVWLVTLIGTAIFGKTASNASEDFDKMDGEMISRALKFMKWNDDRLVFPSNPNSDPGKGNVRLEVSFVHLLEQFRRAYIMDQVSRASFVYNSLQPLGISDETDMLNVIVRKIITNLKMWPTNDTILDLSLSLLKDLSLGYTAVRKLFKLPDIQLLLNNHTSEHFPFLGSDIDYKTMKHRTTFYEALTRLLTTDLNDDETVFARFMTPMTETVQGICEVMNSSNPSVNITQVQRALIGLCRDVRGVAVACTTKNLFQILIDWLYPDVLNVLHRATEIWSDVPELTTPIFRLLAELCQNRQQRLKFEMSSCSAVLLFREVSKIICTWGDRMLQMPSVPKDRVYHERFKNIGIIFMVLKQALVGAYVPFGVFRLYGETCLQNSMDMFIKLFRAVPEEDFHSYTKIAQNYYHLLEAIVVDNMPFISNLDPEIFAAIMRSITQGVLSLDAVVITSACSSLDAILNYLYKRATRQTPIMTKVGMEPEGDGCLRAIETHPELLAELLNGMLSSLMFGEVKCQWSMSRPLLGLILLQEEVYTRIKEDILTQQPANRHVGFEQAFAGLMDGVEPNLTIKNKDAFTQNLAKFRRDVVDIVKGKELSPSVSTANMMM